MNIEKRIKPAASKKSPVNVAKNKSGLVEPDKHENCIRRCNEKIASNPRDELSYTERGDAQLSLANPKEALNDYRRATEINPNSIKAYYGMAAAHTMLGSHKNALLVLTKAMELEQQLIDTAS